MLFSPTFFDPEAGVPLALRDGLVPVGVAVHLDPLPAQPQLAVALQRAPERLQLPPRYDAVAVPVEVPELPLGDPLLDGEVRVLVAEQVREVVGRVRHLVGQLIEETLLDTEKGFS